MAKLKPRARIIRTIGNQLISGPEAAIIELVKNAYDADSPSVNIKIVPPSDEGMGIITIEDAGHGMSFDDILNNWLEPATDNKKNNVKSKSGNRVVLGAKGIGRFACSILGDRLKLISIAQLGPKLEKSVLEIDWKIFDENKYLDDIDIDLEKEEVSVDDKVGVYLEISELKVVLDKRRMSRLIRELRRISIEPTSLSSFSIFLDITSFNQQKGMSGSPYNYNGVELLDDLNQSFNMEQEIRHKNHILPYSLGDECDYLVEGEFDELGGFSGSFTILRGDRVSQELSIPPPPLEGSEHGCSSFSISFKLFDLDGESVEALFGRLGLSFKDFGIRNARKLLSEFTGVSIYRSGFRIRPYGDPENDWLQLEQRRVNDPSVKIGHKQISGVIEVGSELDSYLFERSSREGLEHNGAFERLTNLVTKLLVRVESRRFEYRKKAGLSRKPSNDISKAREIASLESITKSIKNLSLEEQKPILMSIERESRALTETLDEIEAYQKLLESRAALGMVVAQLIHDGRTYLSSITSSAKSLIENSGFLLDDTKKGELVRKYYPAYGEDIMVAARGLGSLFKALDPISGRRRGKPSNFEALKVVEATLALMEESIVEGEIKVDISVPDNLKIYGYEGDLQSSLMNIIQNAIHWLSTVNIKGKTIEISAVVVPQFIQLSIINNGPNISDFDADKLFNAGFSLKSNGHGLGLVISREACRNSKGDLYYIRESADPHFIIELPLGK